MRLDGESTVYSYDDDGGIALYSIEPPAGAITGGSGDPEQGTGATSTRIRWWIAENAGGGYSGGITGVGWFRTTDPAPNNNTTEYEGPFEYYTDEQIFQTAVQSGGNLNSIFSAWNNKHSVIGDITITRFILMLQEHSDAVGCVTPGGATG